MRWEIENPPKDAPHFVLCCVSSADKAWPIRYKALDSLGLLKMRDAVWPGKTAASATRAFLDANPEVISAMAVARYGIASILPPRLIESAPHFVLCCVSSAAKAWPIRYKALDSLGVLKMRDAVWPGMTAASATRAFLDANPEVISAMAVEEGDCV